MEFVELENGSILEIRIDEQEKRWLLEMRADNADANNPDSDYLDTNRALWEFFDPTLCNNEIDWIRPEECGDLTDAPMLGYRGEEKPLPDGLDQSMVFMAGHWDGQTWYHPVEKRWAFMDYAVKSLLVELLEHGKVQLVGGSLA